MSAVLAGGPVTFSGNLVIPAGMTVGNSTRLRIVAMETTNPAAVLPCGSYPNGETQDYTATFIPLANDVSLNAVVDPLPGSCQADSQRVSVRIKNTGTNAQVNVPVHLKVISGTTTLAEVTTVCPLTIPPLGNVIYTFQPAYPAPAGANYIIQASTSLSGDQDPSNDSVSDTLSVSAGSETASGNAEICSTNPPQAGLKANVTDKTDAALWFDSPTAATPVASGIQASTTVIPSNNTYYLGLNEMSGSIGPVNKMQFPNGGYNYFQGNFIRFHNDVPLTIATTRLYLSSSGKVNFTVADLGSFDSCTGAYSYLPISSNTIDVYATTPNISRVPQSINSTSDTGAVFLLDLPVPTPGDHVLIVVAQDSAFIFRNNNITKNPYPMGIPGIFTITGNSAINISKCSDTAFYQQYYYFLYDTRVTLDKCGSPRVAVVAKTPAPAVITRTGILLSSNYASGNQWYYNDTLIAGSTAQTDTLKGPGAYKVVVSDSVGCMLSSNDYIYTPGNDIGLVVAPNPNHGVFTLQFYLTQTANTSLRILDITGQQLYESDYPNFKGSFSKTISLGAVSAGMYVMQLQVGNRKYIQKVMVY